MKRKRTKTLPWKSEACLETAEDVAAYLEAVFEDGDPKLINHALGVVAHSKGMTRELLKRIRKFRGRMPADFRFDRLGSNERA